MSWGDWSVVLVAAVLVVVGLYVQGSHRCAADCLEVDAPESRYVDGRCFCIRGGRVVRPDGR